MAFTKKQIANYLADSDKCPKCGGQIILEEEFTQESMAREVYCADCGVKFHEVYTLTTIEEITD